MEKAQAPIIISSDFSILLETRSPYFKEARDYISRFLELVKSPEIFHTYKLNEISLWNGFAVGLIPDEIITGLKKYSRFPIPKIVINFIEDQYKNYGIVKILPGDEDSLVVSCDDDQLLDDLSHTKEIGDMLFIESKDDSYRIPRALRGVFKLEMIYLGFPIEDLAGFYKGEPYPLALNNDNFSPRGYQLECTEAFMGGKEGQGGAGIIVLPCGSGKTIVGMMIMTMLKVKTLIITPNIVALRQWKTELIDKTDIDPDDIGEYSGECKTIKAITIATYQILVYRKDRNSEFRHLKLFTDQNWGLLIYDEVHLLPAPVFRAIASIQSLRRLGLTATLIREDGKEKDVFALIGPKKYDIPWKNLEAEKHIAIATCYEIRIGLSDSLVKNYYDATEKSQFRIAAENPAKSKAVKHLLEQMSGHQVLIIGQYISQLENLSSTFGIPLITGKTPNQQRIELYDKFKSGQLKALVVSKVANFAIDLPDADVAIQVSGTFGSRQEEAQRLGRIIRPKKGDNYAHFFSLISANTREEVYAHNRKRFLMEQGYEYQIIHEEDLFDSKIPQTA